MSNVSNRIDVLIRVMYGGISMIPHQSSILLQKVMYINARVISFAIYSYCGYTRDFRKYINKVLFNLIEFKILRIFCREMAYNNV